MAPNEKNMTSKIKKKTNTAQLNAQLKYTVYTENAFIILANYSCNTDANRFDSKITQLLPSLALLLPGSALAPPR